MSDLTKAIEKARSIGHRRDGKCSMCAAGDRPRNGLHQDRHRCGNAAGCSLCHSAGMDVGDQCKACGRVFMEPEPHQGRGGGE